MELREEISKSIEEDKQEQQLEVSELNSYDDNKQRITIGGIRLEIMQRLLKESFSKIETAKGENIVMIIGNTGSGKSTITNYLLGCKFKKETNKFGISYASPLGEVFAKMGEDFQSMTFTPEAYKGNDGFVYCDFPGFMDNRGKEEKICISINTQIAVNSANSVKAVMVVIDFGSFKIDKGDSFRKLSSIIGQLLPKPEELYSSIFFIITKTPKKVSGQNVIEIISSLTAESEIKIKRLNSYMQSTWNYVSDKVNWKSTDIDNQIEEIAELESTLKVLKLMQENSNNIVLCNVFDDGQGRDNLIKRLQSSSSINKKQFNFDKYDDARVKFNHLVFKIAHEGTSIICNKIELPEYITQCTSDIEETTKSILFYDKQISSLKDNKTSIDQGENINILGVRVKALKEAAIKTRNEIIKLDEEIEKFSREFEQLDKAEPELYWQVKIHEERHPLGIFGWTTKKFSYNDIPFLHIDKQTQNEASFDVKVNEPNQGRYEAVYASKFYKTGIASLKIYVERRNKPDSQNRIKAIQNEIQLKKKKNKELGNDSNIKRKELETLTQSIQLFQQTGQVYEKNRLKQIEEMEIGKRQLIAKISALENEIVESEKELARAEQVFKERCHLYDIIAKISIAINFNSSLVDEFILQHTRLSSQSTKHSVNGENVPSELTCSITQVIMDDPVTASCGHSFERVAIMRWIDDKDERNCPCCRKPINKKSLTSNINLKQLIDGLKNKTSPALKSALLTAQPFNFFKNSHDDAHFDAGSKIDVCNSKIMDELITEQESLEIKMDRLQRKRETVLKKIGTLRELQVSIQSAKKNIHEDNAVSLVFDNSDNLRKVINQLAEIGIYLAVESNLEHTINLTIAQYSSLVGDASFKNLLKEKEEHNSYELQKLD